MSDVSTICNLLSGYLVLQLQSDLETKIDENDQIKQMCADLIAHQEMAQQA